MNKWLNRDEYIEYLIMKHPVDYTPYYKAKKDGKSEDEVYKIAVQCERKLCNLIENALKYDWFQLYKNDRRYKK